MDDDELLDELEGLKPCPACPDGQVWNMNGPTGATCKVCKGHAVVTLSGAPITKPRKRFD